MKDLATYGGGTYKCKGRAFAEKEMLLFVARGSGKDTRGGLAGGESKPEGRRQG